MTDHSWIKQAIPPISLEMREKAEQHQAQLTKPPGSLGKMEEIAVRLAALQDNLSPSLDRVHIVVFAGDHGVTSAGISAFPQSVTVEMIRNFSAGGAAISVLARHLNASLEVVDVGAVTDPGPLPNVVSHRVGHATQDFRYQPAMTTEQRDQALDVGLQAVKRAKTANTQLLIGGEMGIGNTTSATAILAALLKIAPVLLVGPGTGLNPEGVAHKSKVIMAALQQHQARLIDPLNILATLGGFEIVALSGFYIAAAQRKIPVLVDGFIASAAAVAALHIKPDLLPWLFFSHCSAEPGQKSIFTHLDVSPILDLNMRLGEGSGAAITLPILRLACDLHREMATFSTAAVSHAL